MRGRKGVWAVVGLTVALACGCGGGSGQGGSVSSAGSATSQTVSSPPNAAGTVTVMAPAPLKAALDKVKAAFESGHSGITVRLDYGHIPALLTQIFQGIPADVIVTPDEDTMMQVQGKGVAGTSTVAVARNRLVLVVPAANPAGVKDVKSLGDRQLTIAVCAAELACGKLTSQIAAKAGVTVVADSLEPGGSPAVVTKAAAGEIDLGIAFATDVKAANGKATAIPLNDALGASVTVMAAALKAPDDPAGAAQFLSFLSSAEGKALFTQAGFAPL